ncbi:MAG: preprotein translocase subunit SecA [Deltaproteobacteria bacterium]|nr:preprotein translocase subunit SecA [Deltaproteobacteria bacterium]
MFGSNIVKKVFGTKNDREIKRYTPLVEQINGLEPEFEKLTDAALREKTDEFRQRLGDGETLDDLLPEAFAATREASRRTIGLRHFDAQLIGGMVLHQGKIAEMKTGEGKTLVATLAFYLNALTGKGVHLITVNDYLARRDVQWMGPIYHALGLSVASIVHDVSYRFDPTYITKDYRYLNLRPTSRQDAYRADITYGTNNEFGFDYLRDNMKFALEEYVQRELNFAVVDEVDNILIDEARTPLIISGPAEESTDKYYTLNRIIPKLQRGAVTQGDPSQEDREAILAQGDYTIDEKAKTVSLTESGVSKVERLLGVHNLYDPRHIDMLHHVNQALKAHSIFKRDVDYVIKDGEVIIVDEFTGRLMPGRRWSDGLHQAVEAKEGVHIREENQTLATITIQNYFRMYDKLAGMTGTADTEAPEFKKIYDLDVVVVPTHRPMVRLDHADVVYRTQREKHEAVVEEIAESHAKGQPVLVGTVSVEKSELLSSMLKKRKIRHNVLNAVNHEAEASIIAQAGRFAAVTIATNMAGRGTDILLGGNPEFLARSDMENEWITRAAKLPLQGAQRYEDALRELKEKYDEEMRQAVERYKAATETHEQQRSEALRSFTEIQGRLMGLSPLRDLRQEYERVSSSELIDALHSYRTIPEAYLEVKGELDEAVLAHDEDDAGARREFREACEAFGAFVERWQSADGQRQGLLEAIDDSRRMYEQKLEEYEFVLTRSVVAKGDDVTLVKEFEANRVAFEEAEAQCEALRIPYEKETQKTHEAYESKRQEYVQAVEDVREELEKAPEAYSHRYDEILAGYQTGSADEREKVVAAGGLHILGTERHESRRIDNQLRGRAGRQGDPGASRFFLSLEDDLMRIFGADRMQGIMNRLGMEEGVPIEHGLVSRAIENAQKKVEAHNFDIRKHLLEYDDVMNKQRELVYGRRRDALAGEKSKNDVLEMATQLAEDTVDRFADKQAMPSEWDLAGLAESLRGRFNLRLEFTPEETETFNAEDIEEKVVTLVKDSYESKEERLGEELLRQLEKIIMLQTIDVLWKDHLLNMDHLKEGIGLRGYGQKNPLHEYQREGFELFQEMSDKVQEDVVTKLFTVEVDQEQSAAELEELEARQAPRQMMLSRGDGEGPEPVVTVRRDGDKVGRNAPCPCGSGKKYKRCHGK